MGTRQGSVVGEQQSPAAEPTVRQSPDRQWTNSNELCMDTREVSENSLSASLD